MSALSSSVDEIRGNPEQWAALTTPGNCVVLAPPGSGKTKLLTTRVAIDLTNTIPDPQGAACVTMTNPAAGELRDRLYALNVDRRPALFIGTVHRFVLNRIVLPFAAFAGKPALSSMSIATDSQRKSAYADAINATGPGDHRLLRSTVEHHFKRLSPPEIWAQSGEAVVAVGSGYRERLHAQGLIDFDEIIELGVQFVEQHQMIRRVLTAQYPHMYVDEYQDLAPGLDRLVKALCFDYVHNAQLFAVGDPDQAVYAFTGTRPELLIELAQRSDVTPITLRRNYRCGEEIIRLAHGVKLGQSPVDAQRTGGTVTVNECPGGFPEQCIRATQQVLTTVQAGVPLHEIALICSNNDLCSTLLTALRGAGIAAFFRNTNDYRHTAATAFVEGCAAWACGGRETSNYRLGALLRQWRSVYGPGHDREIDAALTTLLLGYQGRADETALSFLDAVLAVGLASALQRPEMGDDATQIAAMRAALSDGALSDFTIEDLAERARKTDRVEITTMTSSKGLEFDAVLILGLDQDRVPFFAAKTKDQMAEERRKFYVSLTRARDEVHLFYSGFVEVGWGDGFNRKGPSQFLAEVGVL
ncbi:ATP-dependent helicase [Mycobacterium sp.]|uniref:ATP-dependent helicase n=1 Tax=Mycobacterium sp. TaxID=1785 RepID=UPI0025CB8ABC|nr:ATP-dependent helicase [Mycobacterium sp.]